jgi:hypothetical protein
MKRSIALALLVAAIWPAIAQAKMYDAARVGGVSFKKVHVPSDVVKMIHAAKRINTKPYVWGGGHGSFQASGYDCSGSVSYVLNAGGKLDTPAASGPLMSYGRPGPGKWVTVYANAGHAYMVIGKRRFDTIALKQTGARLTREPVSPEGYVARHPVGL